MWETFTILFLLNLVSCHCAKSSSKSWEFGKLSLKLFKPDIPGNWLYWGRSIESWSNPSLEPESDSLESLRISDMNWKETPWDEGQKKRLILFWNFVYLFKCFETTSNLYLCKKNENIISLFIFKLPKT